MADEILRVGAQVDLQNVRSEMDNAASATTDATERMSEGFTALEEASATADEALQAVSQAVASTGEAMAAATAQSAATATAVQSVATAASASVNPYESMARAVAQAATAKANLSYVIRQIVSGDIPGERLQVASLSEALQTNAEMTKNLMAAKAELSTAENQATLYERQYAEAVERSNLIEKEAAEAHLNNALGLRQVAEAEEGAAASGGHMVSSQRAVSGAFMEMEGRLPIRALEQYISKLDGAAAASAVAFEVIGPIALVEVVGTMVERFGNLYNEIILNKSEMDGLTAAEGKLTEAFAKEIGVADQLITKRAELRAREQGMKDAGYSGSGAPTSQQLAAGDRAAAVARENRALDDQRGNLVALGAEYANLERRATAYANIVQGNTYSAQIEGKNYSSTNDNDRRMAQQHLGNVQSDMDRVRQAMKNAQDQIDIDQQEAHQRQLREDSEIARIRQTDARQAASEARAAASEKRRMEQEEVRAWEDSLNQQKVARGAFYQDGLRDDMSYWLTILQNNDLSTRQRQDINEKYLTAKNAFERESLATWVAQERAAAEEDAKESDQRILRFEAIRQAMVDAYGAGSKQAADAMRELTRVIREADAAQTALDAKAARQAAQERRPAETTQTGVVQQATERGRGINQQAQEELREGILSQREYVQVVQDSENAIYAIKLNALEKRRALEALDPNGAEETQRTDNEIQKLKQDHENRLTQIQTLSQQQRIALVQMETQALGAGFNSALQGWESGQKSFAQGWLNILGSMGNALQSELVSWGAKWAAHYVLVDLLHIGSKARQAATDTTAQATQLATTVTTNTAGILSDAALAAAAAFASTAAIPIVGPVLAPEAATAAYASVAAMAPLASAEGGWGMVPADGTMTELHRREMVLPMDLADRVRDMTSGGTTVNNHFGGNTFNGQTANFPQMLDHHEDAVAYKVQSLMRDGKISAGG